MPPHIRVSASAVIIQNGAVLLVEFDDQTGLHYNLPGGGADPGETLAETVRREVREETCAEVSVDRLLLVRDYEPERLGGVFGRRHKLNLVFTCSLIPGSQPSMPLDPDLNQTGVRWVALEQLAQTNLVSTTLAAEILSALAAPDDAFPAYVIESPETQ